MVKKQMIIGFLGLLMFIGLVNAASYTVPDAVHINITLLNQKPDPVQPGQYVELRFKIENKGARDAEDVALEILPSYPFSLEPYDSAVRNIGSMHGRQIGDEGVVEKFRLKVDERATEGENEIELRYQLKSAGSVPYWVELEPFNVDIESHDAIVAISSVISDPEEFSPGEKGKVSINIKNLADSSVKNIKAILDLQKTYTLTTSVTTTEYPFTPIGSTNEKIVELLNPGKEEKIDFSLIADPDAEVDIYKVPLTVEYQDELGTNYSKQRIIGLIISEEPDLIVNIEESNIQKSGMKGKVSFKFVNKGSNDLKFVYTILGKSDDYEIMGKDSMYVGNIDSDDYETVDFEVFVDTKKGTVNLPLRIEYRDANNKEYIEKRDLELKLYSDAEAKKLGFKNGSNSIGIIIVIVIVVGGFLGYRWWRKRRKK